MFIKVKGICISAIYMTGPGNPRPFDLEFDTLLTQPCAPRKKQTAINARLIILIGRVAV